MNSNRGVALLLTLLVLAFLTVLGGAILTAAFIDYRIADNLESRVRAGWLAEAGLEHARELLRQGPPADEHILSNIALTDFSGRRTGAYDVHVSSALGGVGYRIRSVGVIGGAETAIDGIVARTRSGQNIIRVARETDTLAHGAGTPAAYEAVVVNGNAELGPVAGYGILLVRGDLKVVGNFVWHGIVVVEGELDWPDDIGQVNGILDAKTSRNDRVIFDPAAIAAADTLLPYEIIAVRE